MQGCQMVYLKNPNPNLVKFGRALQWKMLVYFMAISSFLRPFGKHILCMANSHIYFPILVCFIKKNLATLDECRPI
jgi:hypothetical protein